MRSELNLEAQANLLAATFATELKQSKQQYLDSLAKLWSNLSPEQHDTLIIVDGRILLNRLLELTEVTVYHPSMVEHIHNWPDTSDNSASLVPYTAELVPMDEGLGKTAIEVRKMLTAGNLGGSVSEGIFLLLARPNLLDWDHHALSCIGSQISPGDRLPGLGMHNQKKVLIYYLDNFVYFGKDKQGIESGPIPFIRKLTSD